MAHTATILFTDLVASTEIAVALGAERADELRKTHFALLREGIAAFGGREVKNLGDGLMVAFAGAGDAVGCAVAMQQAIDRHNRRSERTRLGVRIGISLGDVTAEDSDYYGLPVVEAARLCALANGGQILCTDVVRFLAGGRGDYTFQPLGPLELKGLPEPVPASAVAWDPVSGALPLPPGLHRESSFALVGRAAERAAIDAAWKAATSGSQHIALVSGEPGIGKTRLVTEAALAAHAAGATVLFGRCDVELGMPYQPFVEALRHYVAVCPVPELTAIGEHAGALARLIPEITRRIPGTAPPLPGEPAPEQYALLEAVGATLAAASRRAPVMLVLDDLHWAGRQTLLLLRHVLDRTSSMRLLVLGSYRSTEAAGERALRDALADLRHGCEVHRLPVAGLSEAEVAELCLVGMDDLPEAGAGLARALRRETAGNPFLVIELLRHLSASDASPEQIARRAHVAQVASLGLPQSVRDSVRARLARLPEPAVGVLQCAAVIGEDFELTLLRQVVGLPASDCAQAIDEAISAGLVHGEAGAPRLTFVSDVGRRALYDEIPAPRRSELHRRVARNLEASQGDRVSDLADHWFGASQAAGAPARDVRTAVGYAERAAQRAIEQRHFSAAGTHLRQAEQLVGATDPWSPQHCELLIEAGDALARAGETADAKDAFRRAADVARRLGDRELLGRAAIGFGLGPGGPVHVAGVDETLVGLLEEALAGLESEESVLHVRVLARLAVELHLTGFAKRREALSRDALQMARRIGDPSSELVAAYSHLVANWSPDDLTQRAAGVMAVVRRAEELGDRELVYRGRQLRLRTYLEAGDLDAGDRELAALDETTAQIGQPFYDWQSTLYRAMRALHVGRADEGHRLMLHALDLARRMDAELAHRSFGAQLVLHHWLVGRADELVPLLRDGAESCPWLPIRRARLAFGLAELGRKTEASTELERLAHDDFGSVPRDGNWLMTMAFVSFTAASLGDEPRAALLYHALRPYADRFLVSGDCTTTWGPVATALGVLASARGSLDLAVEHLEDAVERAAATRATAQTVVAQREYARTLLARARPGDADRATSVLDAAASTARLHGFGGLAQSLDAVRAAACV